MHNLWLSWLCVKYGSRLGIYKLLQLLPRLFITTNHRQSSRFFWARAAFCLGRCERLEERRINEICGLCVIWFFLKQKALCRRRRCSRRCCYVINLDVLGCRCRCQCERASERSLAGLTGVWGPRLSWQPDNDLDDELAQAQASRTRRVRARRTASIRQFIVCLLSVTVCYSPLTTHQLPLPFAIALCGLTNSRGGQLIHTKWAQSVKSACCLQVTLYLKISTAQQPESIKLQVAATTPTSLSRYLHATLLPLSSILSAQ